MKNMNTKRYTAFEKKYKQLNDTNKSIVYLMLSKLALCEKDFHGIAMVSVIHEYMNASNIKSRYSLVKILDLSFSRDTLNSMFHRKSFQRQLADELIEKLVLYRLNYDIYMIDEYDIHLNISPSESKKQILQPYTCVKISKEVEEKYHHLSKLEKQAITRFFNRVTETEKELFYNYQYTTQFDSIQAPTFSFKYLYTKTELSTKETNAIDSLTYRLLELQRLEPTIDI